MMEKLTADVQTGSNTVVDARRVRSGLTFMAAPFKGDMRLGFKLSDMFERAGIRHCVVGDMAAKALGFVPIGSATVVGHTFVVVRDEQLDDAHALVVDANFLEPATCETLEPDELGPNTEQVPGYFFCLPGAVEANYGKRVAIMSASYWHLDLDSDEHYEDRTLYLAEYRCRLPETVYYVDALISFLVWRTLNPQIMAGSFTIFLKRNLYDILLRVPKEEFFALLPAEDRFYLDLIKRVLFPIAKVCVCKEWSKIRAGTSTVEQSMTRIPRRGLEFPAYKAAVDARLRAERETKARQENKLQQQDTASDDRDGVIVRQPGQSGQQKGDGVENVPPV